MARVAEDVHPTLGRRALYGAWTAGGRAGGMIDPEDAYEQGHG